MILPVDFDSTFRMVGDEDGDVGLNCKICDRGGMPVVHYTSTKTSYAPYAGTDVVIVDTINDMIVKGTKHLVEIHRRTRNEPGE